jgi:hypothetical protein
MDEGIEADPLAGMGAIDLVNPPPNSTPNPDGSYTDPNGGRWVYDPSTGQWIQVIGGTSTSYRYTPVFYVFGGTVDLTPGHGGGGIASVPPTPGAQCGTGFTSLGLGEHIPNMPNLKTPATIVSIWYVYEPTTYTNNPGAFGGDVGGGSVIVGYIYATARGDYVFQSTGADGSLFNNVLALIPVSAAATNTTTGAFSPPLRGDQINKVFAKFPPNGTGNGSYPCFSRPLPRQYWG